MSVLSRRPGQRSHYRARVTAERFDLVIVGGGNMGAALAGGLLANGIVAADRLAICETLAARRDQLAEQFADVYIGDDVPACAAAVLAVKPGDVADAAAVATAAGARRLLSIAAGVRIAAIEQAAASDDVAVVRAMPNTPALVGEGAAAISGGSAASDDDLTWAERILGGVGLVVRVPEELLDAVTGLSGSGPAYVFLVAESLIDAAVDAGLPAGAGDGADHPAARRVGQAARRAWRSGGLAGDGDVAGRDDGGRAGRARRARPAPGVRRGGPGGDAAQPRAVAGSERTAGVRGRGSCRSPRRWSIRLGRSTSNDASSPGGAEGSASDEAHAARGGSAADDEPAISTAGAASSSSGKACLPHETHRRISAMTPEMRMRARSKAIVRVVAGRMASTLLASGELDTGVDRRTRRVVARRQQHAIAWAERQLGGGGAPIEGEGVHALAVEHQPDGSGR